MLTPGSVQLLQPRKKSLLSILAESIAPDLMKVISEADYGYGANKHLSALEAIQDTLEIPAPLNWEPKEVLELIRWSRPNVGGWKPGLPGHDGHLIRAFTCAVLVVAATSEETREFIDDENSTLAPLIESLGVLGNEYQSAGLSELAWRIEHPTSEWEDEPFFWLGLLVLAVRVFQSKQPYLIGELVDSLLASERHVRESGWCVCPEDSSAWLFGLTHFNLNQDIWVTFGQDLRACAVTLRDDNAAKLAQVAALLEGQTV